ncbi:T9SS type A sorting domain-containing protein [Hymenobacter armeniacus]|uniref:T9SS type A sorting domain-containing protein n=1 Tax=Hymenobacter armeniacus TaxID=2771358 RepID=A0ABR8JY53_9BACT|nr:T9SS type A sorting domain-containing protein [Hymenobacter armeniacus]MBD2723736.1 T9SS type A sorting domain-containing protein [Hymenobacter armeniacus]
MKQQLHFILALSALAFATAPAQAQTPAAKRGATGAAPVAAQRLVSNSAFRLVQTVKQQYRSNAWLDTLRFTYSRFTALNLPQRELRENAPTRGAALRALRQENYQYNAAGKMTSDSTFAFTNGVVNTTALLALNYTYDTQGRLLQELQSIRSNGVWRPYGRSTYTYNALGQNTRILDESYFGSAYFADDQELFTYNAAGQVATDEFQLADLSGTVFSPFQRNVYTYNASGLRQTDVQQRYTNGAYVDDFRVTNTYTATPIGTPAAYQLASYLVERVGSTPGVWQPYSRGTETYDADGNLTVDLYQPYVSGAYVNDFRYLYTYQRVLATTASRALQAQLAVVPNPATGGTTAAALHYVLPTAAPVAVTVLDALGRAVLTLPARAQSVGEHTLALPALPRGAGVYAVRLSTGTQSQTVKLVLE